MYTLRFQWWLIWGIAFLVETEKIFAQSPFIVSLRHYSLEQGLPNRIVLDIGQDARGFIWVATIEDTYRFDGRQFTGLQLPKQYGQTQLPFSVVALHSDPANNLWLIGSQPGQQRQLVCLPDSQFVSASLHYIAPILSTNKRHTLPTIDYPWWPANSDDLAAPLVLFNQKGEIWRYNQSGRFKRIYTRPATSDPTTYVLSQANGNIWLSYQTGVVTATGAAYIAEEINGSGKQVRRHILPALLHPISGRLSADPPGTLYLYRDHVDFPQLTAHHIDNLLYRLSPTGQLTNLPIPFTAKTLPASLQHNWRDIQVRYDAFHELFWVLGKAMLFAWHPQQGIVFDLAQSGFPVATLQTISTLFIDRTGVVWAGSQNGLLQLILEPNRFHTYLSIPEKAASTAAFSMRGMVPVGKELWVNADKIYRLNLTTGHYELIQPKNVPQHFYYTASRGHDGHFWAAFRDLIHINPTTLEAEEYHLTATNNACWAMWQDGQHNFWLGYDQGLSVFDWNQKKNKPFTAYNQFTELAQNRINGFFPNKRLGRIWVAASSGLYVLDTLQGIVSRYSSQDKPPHYLPFNHITFVHPDASKPGLYWLATRGGGLIRWESRTGTFQQITQANGLLNNSLYCIYEDKQGRLWLPSDYGLAWLQKQTVSQQAVAIQVFLPKDGIAHEEFNLTSHYRAPDGRLFLGGLNGITAFYPDSVQVRATTNAPLVVTRYQKLNPATGEMEDQTTQFSQTGTVDLRATDRTMSLSFALLDYRYNSQFRLWYRMRGIQNGWIMEPRSDLRINGLPSGDYKLEVRAQNANGQWASAILTIPIRMQPPLYQTGWFWVVSLVLLVSVVGLLFRWRNRQLRRTNLRLEGEVARRTAQLLADNALIEQQAGELRANASLREQFLANISHEFRTPLTLLLGPIDYLLKQTQDDRINPILQTMRRNAQQLLTLVTNLLDLSKADAGQLVLQELPTDVRQLVYQTTQTFASQAQLVGVDLRINSSSGVLWLLVDGPKLETVLKNLLANALRFTASGQTVVVTLREEGTFFLIEVSDTGSGIHPDDLPFIFDRYYQAQHTPLKVTGGTGIGLALSQEYTHRWGGAVTVQSWLGRGSRFTVSYPLHPLSPLSPEKPFAASVLPANSQKITSLAAPPLSETWPWPHQGTQEANRPTLLLIDDNPDMLAYLQLVLSPYYQLQLASHGQQALNWLRDQSMAGLPDLIVSDMMMPQMDGLSFLTALRQLPSGKDLPVIILSARSSLVMRLETMRLGVVDYLTKPFEEEELLTRIHHLLKQSAERNAWRSQQPVESLTESASELPDSINQLVRIQEYILANLSNPALQIGDIAKAAATSERQLLRQLKAHSGLSPSQFLQEMRLQTAREWLEDRRYSTVKEVALRVGFQKTSYFSQLFGQRFGISPSKILRPTTAFESDAAIDPLADT